MEVVGAIDVPNLHLSTVNFGGRVDSIDLNVGIIITCADLVPNRKKDVLLHQEYFIWMVVYTFGLEQAICVEIDYFCIENTCELHKGNLCQRLVCKC